MIYDIRDPDFLTNPTPMLAQMRAEGPLVQVRIPVVGRCWLTTTDAAAREVLKSPDRFVRNMATKGGKPIEKLYWWLPGPIKPLLRSMIGADGAAHARLRGEVDRAFARVEIAQMQDAITGMADRLIDDLPGGPIDLVDRYARPLPLMAICELLGIPAADRDRVSKWITPLSAPTTTLNVLRAMPGLWRLVRHFKRDFQSVRSTPRPGLIGDLVAQSDLTDDELMSMVVILFLAGHETTVHLITMCLRALLADRDLRDRLTGDPAAQRLFVEEILRYDSPVMITKPMFVGEDSTFHGISLKRGDRILALLIGANHDPARFHQAEVLDPARRPNAHLGFGHGPHVCLGMQLARVEAQVAIDRMLTRLPGLDRVGGDDFVKRIGIRGLTQLRVRVSPDDSARNNI